MVAGTMPLQRTERIALDGPQWLARELFSAYVVSPIDMAGLPGMLLFDTSGI